MIHKIFTIHDTKAVAYLPPFLMHQAGMAIRTFKDCIQSDDHQFGKNPEDYILFEIGHFDDTNAEIINHTVPINHGSGLQFVSNGTGPAKLSSEERTP